MPTPKFRTLAKLKNVEEPKYTAQDLATDTPEESQEVVAYNDTEVSKLSKIVSEKVEDKPFNLKFVPREKIIFNEANHYDIDDVHVEELADSILHMGLIHNLEAMWDEEQGVYVLDSGHCRTAALDKLFERFKNADKNDPDYQLYQKHVEGFFVYGFPVSVKRREYEATELSELDAINTEIRLLDANEKVRQITPAKRAAAIARKAELLERKNALVNRSEKVNINKTIGQDLGISDRQVQKYRSIEAGLIPELKALFDNEKITVNDGDTWSKLTEEEQRNIILPLVNSLVESGKKASEEAVNKEKMQREAVEKELKRAEAERRKAEEVCDQLRGQYEKAESEAQHLNQEFEAQIVSIKEAAAKEKTALEQELIAAKESGGADKITELQGKLKETKERNNQELMKVQEKQRQLLEEKDKKLKRLEKRILEEQNAHQEMKTTLERDIRQKIETEARFDVVMEQLKNALYTTSTFTSALDNELKEDLIKKAKTIINAFLEKLDK